MKFAFSFLSQRGRGGEAGWREGVTSESSYFLALTSGRVGWGVEAKRDKGKGYIRAARISVPLGWTDTMVESRKKLKQYF